MKFKSQHSYNLYPKVNYLKKQLAYNLYTKVQYLKALKQKTHYTYSLISVQ